jgi:hypothetical protein
VSHFAEPDRIRERADIERLDGERVSAIGRYVAIPAPVKGDLDPPGERDHAVVVLDDDTQVFLEPIDDPRSARPRDEIDGLDGQVVLVIGRVHRYMPARGATLMAPCLADLETIGLATAAADDASNAGTDDNDTFGAQGAGTDGP